MIAAAAGRTDVCLLLLQEGADPLLEDPDGRTACRLAELAGHQDLAFRLSQRWPTLQALPAREDEPQIDLNGDLVGWEPEEEIVPPTSKHSFDEVLHEIQEGISAYRLREAHDEWSFADVTLPIGRPSHLLALSLNAKSTMAAAIAEGSIPVSKLRNVWPAANAFEFQLLCTVMREAGAKITSGRNDVTWNSCGEAAISSSDRDTVEVVLSHVENERTQDLTTTGKYLNDIDRYSPFSPDRERRIFLELSRVKQELHDVTAICMRIAGFADAVPDDRTEPESTDGEVETVDEVDSLSDLVKQEPNSQPGRLLFEVSCRLLEKLAAERSHPDVIALNKTLEKYRKVRDRAMEGGLKIVPFWAQKYRHRGLPLEDLIQEGNLGLMRAVEKFDPSKGARFGAYATYWIRQSMLRAIDDLSRVIRVPVHLAEALRKAARIREAIRAGHNRDATVEELARKLECSTLVARRLFEVPSVVARSIPAMLADGDLVSADQIPHEKSLRRLIGVMLNKLSPRSEYVLRLRFGLGGIEDQTLEEVGQRFDVTRERIRQIEAKALRVLSHPTRMKLLQASR